jgi:hypothetical protein
MAEMKARSRSCYHCRTFAGSARPSIGARADDPTVFESPPQIPTVVRLGIQKIVVHRLTFLDPRDKLSGGAIGLFS